MVACGAWLRVVYARARVACLQAQKVLSGARVQRIPPQRLHIQVSEQLQRGQEGGFGDEDLANHSCARLLDLPQLVGGDGLEVASRDLQGRRERMRMGRGGRGL